MRRRGNGTTLEGTPRARRFFRRRPRGSIVGTVRIDRRTKNLLHRIRPGEIAIILHDDLDQVAAEGLLERDLVLRGEGLPELKTKIKGRAAVVVVRGHEYRQDLRTLRPYISDMHPVLIAVDGAADALLDEGLKPDVIIGDMDSVSTNALTCGAEVVVHAYPDGRAPGLDRVQALGIAPSVLASSGTREILLLIAAAVVAMAVAASLSPALRLWGQNIAAWLRSVWRSIF